MGNIGYPAATMSYEPHTPSELLPFYPPGAQIAYPAVGFTDEAWPSLSREEKYQRLASTIGNTPILSFQFDDVPGTVHAKLELASPTGTHYDRQLPLFSLLERHGIIRPGITTLRDLSSGSLLASWAPQATAMGFALEGSVPSVISENRRSKLVLPGSDIRTAGFP